MISDRDNLARLSTFDPSTIARRSRAFTFLEVLFAVIIVGIGFIMIAAIFPVAISQTQANVSEATGIAVGRDAIRYLQGQLALPIAPGSGTTPLPYTTQQATGGSYYPEIVPVAFVPNLSLNLNQVLTADRRFSWTALYRRDYQRQTVNGAATLLPAAYAQLYVVVSQNTAEGQVNYGSGPVIGNNSGTSPYNCNFFGAIINPNASTITISNYASMTGALGTLAAPYTLGQPYDGNGSVTEGAFAIVVDAANVGGPQDANEVVGWYGQLGVAVPGATNTWYLQTPPPASYAGRPLGWTNGVYVFILGKPINPLGQLTTGTANGYPNYDGPAQDVTCTSGFARINN